MILNVINDSNDKMFYKKGDDLMFSFIHQLNFI